MAIVTSKLISAAVLQLPFVDKEGEPLTQGVVTFYQPDMVTLKNVYYQSGTPGNYTYIAAPNPMTLSGAGTPTDVNGNDIILFYYPYSETDSNISQPYFVTAYDDLGTLQFTRSNFPFITGGGSGPATIATLENYVINNRFWRNIGSVNAGTLNNTWTVQYNNSGTVYYQTLCPDQHDGFSMPDFNYIKNVNGSATETITFNTFPKTSTPILTGDIGPEFYINHTCTADTSGSTLKVYQFPVSLHLATLVGETFSFTIQGQSISGNATIAVYMYQFCGTGVSSPAPLFLGNITFGADWTKFTLEGLTFPGTTGLTLGSDGTGGNDDAYYLQIALPTGSSNGICNLNFTLPSIYLSELLSDVPTNSFSTYDQIDSVVASARTGDVKTSINTFYPFGWVPMSGGTLAHPNTGSTTVVAPTNLTIAYQGNDGWALYNLLWNAFSNIVVNSTELVQIYDATGAPTTFGASSYADWNALKQLALTEMTGRVVMGTVPISAMTKKYSTTFTASSGSGIVVTTANPVNVFQGMPVTFLNTGGALPTGLVANTIYFVTANGNFSSTTFNVSTTYANAMAGTTVAFTDTGSGTQTVIMAVNGTLTGEYAHAQLSSEVGSHTHAAATSVVGFNTASGSLTNVIVGSGGSSGGRNPYTLQTTISNNTPAGVAFNVTQPSAFYNIFMKL
jgi:hypothetical protein